MGQEPDTSNSRDATFNERRFPVSIDAYEMIITQKPLPGVLLVGINKNMSLGTRGNGPEIQPSPKLENTIDISIDGRTQMQLCKIYHPEIPSDDQYELENDFGPQLVEQEPNDWAYKTKV